MSPHGNRGKTWGIAGWLPVNLLDRHSFKSMSSFSDYTFNCSRGWGGGNIGDKNQFPRVYNPKVCT